MSAVAPPLSAEDCARGRRLAITSHPLGNTFRLIFTQHLPTLALVSLGASEFQVGLQSSFVFVFIALQLPTLRAVGRFSKRSLLVASHTFAVMTALPLVFWAELEALPGSRPVDLAMLSFGLVAVGVCIGETVWFPMLRAFVLPERIGRFFGTLRTGWHLALIFFYLFSQWWLDRHPGDFATLFGVGWALGFARTFLIARLPERSERTGERIRAREALALLRDPRLRRYLEAVAWGHAIRMAAVPFVIVMLRRVVGFTDTEVMLTTVAHFTGGVASLYAWGRAVDRVGAIAVLRWTSAGQAVLLVALFFFAPVEHVVGLMVGWFFLLSVLASGFGVADTHVLFELTPPEAPTRTLVLGAVGVGIVTGSLPILAGALLQVFLPEGEAGALGVYQFFFAGLGMATLLVLRPLRRLSRAVADGASA